MVPRDSASIPRLLPYGRSKFLLQRMYTVSYCVYLTFCVDRDIFDWHSTTCIVNCSHFEIGRHPVSLRVMLNAGILHRSVKEHIYNHTEVPKLLSVMGSVHDLLFLLLSAKRRRRSVSERLRVFLIRIPTISGRLTEHEETWILSQAKAT